jgi:uncharacterized protein (DUF4415 family)
MTSAEIRKKHPLTANKLKRLKKIFAGEPDMTDPDNPDVAELLEKGLARRIGRPPKAVCKDMLNLRVDHFDLLALRHSGRGWQTRVSNWISEGIRKGVL